MVGFSVTKTSRMTPFSESSRLDAEVFEVAGVPERVEVALDGERIVGVADAAEQAGKDGFLGDAPVADDADLGDDLLLRPRRDREEAAKEG